MEILNIEMTNFVHTSKILTIIHELCIYYNFRCMHACKLKTIQIYLLKMYRQTTLCQILSCLFCIQLFYLLAANGTVTITEVNVINRRKTNKYILHFALISLTLRELIVMWTSSYVLLFT